MTIPAVAADLQDERLRQSRGVVGAVRDVIDRVRGGDLGLIPVIAGLIVISTVLQIRNSIFLSSQNLVNLLMEAVPVGVISLGIVCVLLVGEIDLSVGSVSGLSAAALAVLYVTHGWSVWLAMAAAIALGSVIGWVYAQIYNRIGVPSFVISLAGLLAFMGLQLKVLGKSGSINVPFDSSLVRFAQLQFVPAWLSYVLVVGGAAVLFVSGAARDRARRSAGLSSRSMQALAARSVAMAIGLGFAVWYLNRARGIGWMFAFFVASCWSSTTRSPGRGGVAPCTRSGATPRRRAGPASTCGPRTRRRSCCAPRSRHLAEFSPRHGWRPPTKAAVAATPTSTPSPPP